jgi:ferritin
MASLLKPDIKKWLNKSVESELYASNLYKHIANQLQRLGLFGSQKYFLNESSEELTHYQKLVDYTNDMGDVIEIPQVPKINETIKSIKDALTVAYDFELSLMRQYEKFYDEAEDKFSDCVTATFIIELIQIQRQSVGDYGDLIARYDRNPNDVFEFDEYLGEK